jgi:lysozyme
MADMKGRAAKAGLCAGALAACLSVLPPLEGVVLKGYRDPVGIVTACMGETKTAVLGRAYSREECDRLLELRVVEHAEGVNRCVPLSGLTKGQQAAAVSFTYNVGVNAFCSSTFARKLRAGDPTACLEVERWIYATKPDGARIVLPGLVKRRATERAICEGRM